MAGLSQAQTDVIKQRQADMKANGASMKAINGILEANGPAADVAAEATKIHEKAMEIATLFPAGSDQGDTKAKPEIWQTPDDFAAKLKALQDESAMLVTAANGGDMMVVKAQYEKLGGTCGGCHKVYKNK
ncbi:MAG TPA: cytochrome c [Dongiaceae bacterium]|nr:cytochrome c [Dongiaceae bacterium]